MIRRSTMNNFIDLLTKEEKAILCGIINGQEFNRCDEKEKREKILDEKQKVINKVEDEHQQYEQNKKTELDERIKNLEADKQQEIKQLEDNHKQSLSKAKSECQQIIKSIEEEKTHLE